MRELERCAEGGPRKANGNCTNPDPGDGLPVQCVGPWVKDKHHYLREYIEETSGTRRNYLSPTGGRPFAGGAAFIDLFAGPGRARIRSTGEIIDGSPLIALSHVAAPFSRVILCDVDEENVSALEARTAKYGKRVSVVPGDCHAKIDEIMALVPRHAFNIALIDGFNLGSLLFPTIAKLAQRKRMDLIIHFPTMDAKRNYTRGALRKLGHATGSNSMEDLIGRPKDIAKAILELRASLKSLGYTGYRSIAVPIKNTKNGTLYHLLHASKAGKGDAIWSNVTKRAGSGQISLPLVQPSAPAAAQRHRVPGGQAER
jgi:three-Cys-motif partner protein